MGQVTSKMANKAHTLKSFVPLPLAIHKFVRTLSAPIPEGVKLPIGRHIQVMVTIKDRNKKIVCLRCNIIKHLVLNDHLLKDLANRHCHLKSPVLLEELA